MPAGVTAEDPGLLDGLVGTRSAQFGRTIRREQQQGDGVHRGLDDGGQQVGDRGAGGGDDGGGAAGGAGVAQREETRTALVEMHVRLLGGAARHRQRQRRGTRAGRDAKTVHAVPQQLFDEQLGSEHVEIGCVPVHRRCPVLWHNLVRESKQKPASSAEEIRRIQWTGPSGDGPAWRFSRGR